MWYFIMNTVNVHCKDWKACFLRLQVRTIICQHGQSPYCFGEKGTANCSPEEQFFKVTVCWFGVPCFVLLAKVRCSSVEKWQPEKLGRIFLAALLWVCASFSIRKALIRSIVLCFLFAEITVSFQRREGIFAVEIQR